jgi:hypothetical protein
VYLSVLTQYLRENGSRAPHFITTYHWLEFEYPSFYKTYPPESPWGYDERTEGLSGRGVSGEREVRGVPDGVMLV